MKVVIYEFDLKEEKIALQIEKDTAAPAMLLRLTFDEFHSFVSRLRQIEGHLFTSENKG